MVNAMGREKISGIRGLEGKSEVVAGVVSEVVSSKMLTTSTLYPLILLIPLKRKRVQKGGWWEEYRNGGGWYRWLQGFCLTPPPPATPGQHS